MRLLAEGVEEGRLAAVGGLGLGRPVASPDAAATLQAAALAGRVGRQRRRWRLERGERARVHQLWGAGGVGRAVVEDAEHVLVAADGLGHVALPSQVEAHLAVGGLERTDEEEVPEGLAVLAVVE